MSMKGLIAGAVVVLASWAAAAQAQVTLYEHCNFAGKAVAVPEGAFSLGALERLGVRNDDVSAVRVPAGFRVTLYEHTGFVGKSRVLTQSEGCLVGAGWNDILSSVRVERIDAAAGVDGGNVVRVDYDGGAFVRSGRGWVEIKNDGALSFHFIETSRSADKVALFDPSRNVRIDLALAQDKILYGVGAKTDRALYDITGSTAQDPTLDPAQQCIHGKFGVGYVAKVRWYFPHEVRLDPTTNTMSLRPGAQVYKEENVPVFGTSCVQTGHRMIASVSVIGGKFAKDFTNVAIGTVVTVVTGAAGVAACVGSVGTACGAAAVGVGTAVSTAVAVAATAIPDAKTTIFFGAPRYVELTGTVFDAAATETR